MSAVLGFVTAALQYGVDSILVKPRRSIGAFTAQVVIEETHIDELEITEHPVEQGATVSDHAWKRPAEVTIMAGWSNSPSITGLFQGVAAGLQGTVQGVQSIITGNSPNQVRDVYARLLELQASRIPFDVYTGKRVYQNMLIKSLKTTTSKETENALIVTAVLKQVIVVATQIVVIPASAANQSNASATQPTTDSGTRQLVPSTRFVPGGP